MFGHGGIHPSCYMQIYFRREKQSIIRICTRSALFRHFYIDSINRDVYLMYFLQIVFVQLGIGGI